MEFLGYALNLQNFNDLSTEINMELILCSISTWKPKAPTLQSQYLIAK